MPTPLLPSVFTAESLPLVEGASFGDCAFGKIATAWIRCFDQYDCALQSIAARGTQVFLYRNTEGDLVGFGSIGTTSRKIRGVQVTWSIIPQVGVVDRFHGKPKGDASNKYSTSIMVDLMARAKKHGTPILMLKVHKENTHAVRLYDYLGFVPMGEPNPVGYQIMTVFNCE